VTTYVESAAGIAEGGKNRCHGIGDGAYCFLLSLFLWPLAEVVPSAATAPALIVVGFLMMEPILKN